MSEIIDTAPNPGERETSFLGRLRPDRSTAPVIVAAAGTLLLTTADAQPLFPRGVGFGVAPMGEAGQITIIAPLIIVSVLAIFHTWRNITALAAIMVAAVGVAALVINFLVLHPAISVLDIMTRRSNWSLYLALFLLPFFSCVATAWMGVARDARGSRFASGVLLATGAFGYLSYFQQLDLLLTYRSPDEPGPGRAALIGMLGAGVVLVAGVIARAENIGQSATAGHAAPADRGSAWIAKLAAVAAAIAIAVAAVYEYVVPVQPSATPGFVLSVIANFTVYVIGPSLLAAGAALIVVGKRDLDRRFAAGVMVTGCLLVLTSNLDSHVFGWLVPLQGSFGWVLEGSDIGVGAGLAMGLAG